MKPKICLISSLLLLSIITFQPAAYADTEVGREITADTTWTLAGSPYIVTQNILVKQGVTLTIEQGVIVKFDKDMSMFIEGKLLARGTQNSMITFSGNSSTPTQGYWGAIHFDESSPVATFDGNGNYSDGSIMEYCIVEYGYGRDGGTIFADSTSPFVNACLVRNCSYGLRINNGNYPTTGYRHPDLKITKITNNTIQDFHVGGITMNGDNCLCSNNTIKNGSGGIYAVGFNCIITGNSFEGVGIGTAILCTSYPGSETTYEISNNTIRNGQGTAIYADGGIGSLNIIGNIIEGINTKAGVAAGVIIHFDPVASPQNVIIHYNTFSNNTWFKPTNGAYGAAGAINGFGIIEHNCFSNNKTDSTGGANILYITGDSKINFNNFESTNPGYDVYDSLLKVGGPDIDVTNNYWGTTDENVIQSKIFDFFTNSIYTKVNYAPFLTAPVSCDPSAANSTTTTVPTTTTTVPVTTTTTMIVETTTTEVVTTTTTIPDESTTTTEPPATTTTTTQPETCEILSIQPSGITVGFGILPRIKTIAVSFNVDLEEAGITAEDVTFENAPKGVTILSTKIIDNNIEAVVLFWGVTPGTYNVNLGTCGSKPFAILRF
jgi:hypothetical protein